MTDRSAPIPADDGRLRPSGRRLFCIAGEPSGDIHAGHLLRELKGLLPDLETYGFGGKNMAAAGFEVLIDLPSQAIMGLFPVIAALPKIRGWFKTAAEVLKKRRPDAVLLVDYPGFNLRLAATVKKLGIPVIYYISPQVWAWNRRRIKKIARVVDLMLVILPFEADLYKKTGLDARYVGHPIVDHIEHVRRQRTATPPGLAGLGRPVISIFPGSRGHVVDSLWPVFRRVVENLARRPHLSGATFVVAAADAALAQRVERELPEVAADLRILVGESHAAMEVADVCLTTSGTTTLEIAVHEKPMLIAYRISRAVWTIGKMVVSVPYIGLVNLIAEKGVCPEFIGPNLDVDAIADALDRLLRDGPERRTMIDEISRVKEKLATPGSYRRAAAAVAERLTKK